MTEAPNDQQRRSAEPTQIAVCRSYEQLRDTLVRWCQSQQVTRQQLDAEAGLPDGLAGKLLSPRRARRRRTIRRFGSKTLGPVLEVLGLELVVQIRPEAPVRAEATFDASEDASERKLARQDWRRQHGSKWGKRMAALRTVKLSPAQRRASAQMAARKRWERHSTGAGRE